MTAAGPCWCARPRTQPLDQCTRLSLLAIAFPVRSRLTRGALPECLPDWRWRGAGRCAAAGG